MELAVALFLGAWIFIWGFVSYKKLVKENLEKEEQK